MTPSSGPSRLLAALVSLIAFVGLAIQFSATFGDVHTIPLTLSTLSRFFTILANLFVAFLFGAFAMGRMDIATPGRLGCATLAILLVGVVYGLLLDGLHPLVGAALAANIILHKVTPVIVPLCWLLAAPKGYLTRRDPWLWALYPLAYLVYALVRGTAEGKFAYPFLNYPAHGWLYVIIHIIIMTAGFLIVGHGLLLLDRRMAARRP